MELEGAPRRSRFVVAAAVAAAAVVLGARLLIPPIVGLADNGDFSRLMLPGGLAHPSAKFEERYFHWASPRFLRVAPAPDPGNYRTSESLLLRIASAASRVLDPGPTFDIRFLGALHALLLLLAVGALVHAAGDLRPAAQWTAAALLVLFFTDAGYVASFNSLYSQTASFSFLLLTAASAAVSLRRGRFGFLEAAAYFSSAAMFVLSKPQESVTAPLLALFGLRLAWVLERRRRNRATAAALAAILCFVGALYYRSAQRSIGWITRYNLIFVEILPRSPSPGRDLAEMGIDPKWAKSADVRAWGPDSPARDPAVRAVLDGKAGTSPRMFLLRHPDRLLGMLRRAADVSTVLQPPELGNFTQESGKPALEKAPGIWNAVRAPLSGFGWLAVLLGGTVVAAASGYRRASAGGRLLREGLALLCVMAAGAFLASAIGDWHVDIVRHLYAFHATCDLILVAGVVGIVQAAGRRRGAGRAHVLAGVGAAAVVLGVQLSGPSRIGLADNGDFRRVMAPAGLAYRARAEGTYFAWARTEFDFAPPRADPDGYRSSETLLARTAVAAAKAAARPTFDVGWIAAVHALLLLTALALMLDACGDLTAAAQWTAAALLVLVFTDVAYAAPLAAVYAQTASLLFLLLAVGFAAGGVRRGGLTVPWLAGYFACALLFVLSKPQSTIHAPLLALFGVRLAWTGPGRRRLAGVAFALGLCGAAFGSFRASPPRLREAAVYHVVFAEILANSPDRRADLEWFGLPPGFERFAGIDAYRPGAPLADPAFREAFQRLGHSDILRFYLGHPERIASVVRRAAWKAARMRPPFFGNYPRDAGMPAAAQTRRFASWSDLKFRIRPAFRITSAALWIGTIAGCAATWRSASPVGRRVREGFAILAAMAASEFLVCAFADAHIEIVRHLYVFHALWDLVLIGLAVWGVQALATRSRSLPNRASPATA